MSGVQVGMVSSAVVALLESVLAFPIGAGGVPTPANRGTRIDAREGYGIVHQVPPTVTLGGSWAGNGHSALRVRYQVSGFGVQMDQAERCRDLMVAVLVDQGEDRDYVHDLTVAGHQVELREFVDTAPIDGVEIVQAPALVDLTVVVV